METVIRPDITKVGATFDRHCIICGQPFNGRGHDIACSGTCFEQWMEDAHEGALEVALRVWGCETLEEYEQTHSIAVEAIEDTNGDVYIVQAGRDGPIKIGYSTQFEKRWSGLQTASPIRLYLLARIRGGKDKEEELHIAFGEYRRRGEWFNPGPKLVKFIRDLQNPIRQLRLDTDYQLL